MSDRNALIEKQYHLPELYENILNRLKHQGVDINNVKRSDVAGVDEFHLRGAEVSKELMTQLDFKNLKVLDVGSGLGGPCRMLADEFNCHAYGIDISQEYVRTAQKISEIIQINGTTEFVQGDALKLPFKDHFFDVVWTQHVQMNIEDKHTFYSEIYRVLKHNGSLIYYDIFKRANQDVHYPVPWANNHSISFLQTIVDMDNILKSLGFNKTRTTHQTQGAIKFLKKILERTTTDNPVGLNVLLGDSTNKKLSNVLKSLVENKIELQSGIYKK